MEIDCGGALVFLEKGAVEAGVIQKAEPGAAVRNLFPALHGVHTGGQALFRDVPMKRQAGVLLDQVGDIEFAQKQLPAQSAQAEICVQVAGDIVCDRLKAGEAFSL